MNKYPVWKYVLLALVLVCGVVFALPNLYGDHPAVQVSARSGEIGPDIEGEITAVLGEAGIKVESFRRDDNRLLALFADDDTQQRAKEIVQGELSGDHVVALNLVPATPEWLRKFAKPVSLGLDLRGGVHFLMEVDMETAITNAERTYVDSFRTFLRENKIRFRSPSYGENGITVRFTDEAQRDNALSLLRNEFRDLEYLESQKGEEFVFTARLSDAARDNERRSALQQNITTLRNRVNELGVAEPIIQQQGKERIVVQLPGVQDTAEAKNILGATATLEYRMVHGTYADWSAAEQSGRVPANARLYENRAGGPILLQRKVIVTGDQIKDASSGIDTQSGSPAVFISLDGVGAKRMQRVSADNIGNPMAVVFIENRMVTKKIDGEYVKKKQLVEEVINVATIRDVLSHRFQTTGLETEEARNLSLLLRAGALKAPIEIVEERTVGPSLGQDNIDRGKRSVLIGLALVLLFMAYYYRVFGVIADCALVANLVLIVAVLSTLPATLTLPGIAGIVLTVGMAVDANVLIFERIREELRAGNAIQSAIDAGYEKAFVTIADANVTTLIAAVVLFIFGTGPIKGFAVTLCIGILTSMFTAIFGTRAIVNWLYGGKRGLQALPI
ncbi:protein-export membrane protein SecD [Chromatiales bacterium (ex Bugula neritina AB1)]|nr:protein-export membrane protein SecD [Chromatiales bacterium (ex Bugula neritina AB1)]